MHPIFPAFAIVVAWAFSAQLWRQWHDRRRAHALAWALSLALFGVGHVGVLIGITAGWSPVVFGAYWLSGALLNVPLLAIGQLHLLDSRRSVIYWTVGGLAAIWCLVFTVTASYDTAALAAAAGGVPSGEDVIGGEIAYALLRPMTSTFVIVVVGSAWSAVRFRKWSLLLIALGTTVAAGGSSVIGQSYDYLFPVLSAAGVALMYVGFRTVSTAARPTENAPEQLDDADPVPADASAS